VARALLTSRAASASAGGAFALTVGGLVVFPALAIVGGLLFALLGTCLAYDIEGLGARWISFERSFGAPTLGISAWLQRTIDGAAIACLGIAVVWVSAFALA
jgi:hypothetical protein